VRLIWLGCAVVNEGEITVNVMDGKTINLWKGNGKKASAPFSMVIGQIRVYFRTVSLVENFLCRVGLPKERFPFHVGQILL
jgi:hypothetical protein